MRPRAVFLDRDGTIIAERHYLKDPSGVSLLEGAGEALLLLKRMRFRLVIITNQSGIKRGLLSADDLERVHDRLRALLEEKGVTIDGIYFSPDLPDEGSSTRKPGTALVERAVRELGLSLRGSYCIGDKPEDITLGKRKEMRTILVLTGYGASSRASVEADYIAKDLLDAARWIERQEDEPSLSLFEKQ